MQISKKEYGFTLIEVLIAMTLLSIMVVLLFSSLKTSAESWDIGERKISQVNENAVVYNFFQRHLSTAQPLWNNFDHYEQSFSFTGSENSLQFVSAFPASAGRKGLQLFNINLTDSENASITVTIRPFFTLNEGSEWKKEEVVLIENVSHFTVSYFARDAIDQSAVWEESWQEKERLPELVKIQIQLEDERFWPEMIFPLKIQSVASVSTKSSNRDPDV